MKNKEFNKPLTDKKPTTISTGKKIMWGVFGVVSLLTAGTEAFVAIYNNVKTSNQKEIVTPQQEQLFESEEVFEVTEDGNVITKEEHEEIKKQQTDQAGDFLTDMLKEELCEKCGLSQDAKINILSVFECNLMSDQFDVKNKELNILAEIDGKIACISVNSTMCKTKIKQVGNQTDMISSLTAYIKNSSIKSVQFMSATQEQVASSIKDKNILFIGEGEEYIEKNGEASWVVPVYHQVNGNIYVEYYKNLQSEIDKFGFSLDIQVMMKLSGMNEDLLEKVDITENSYEKFNQIFKKEEQKEDVNEDDYSNLFPEDEYMGSNKSCMESNQSYVDFGMFL